MTHPDPRLISGFSLVEVMIAVMVLCMGVIAIASMQTTSVNSTGSARQTIEATVTAGRLLERIQTLPFSDSMLIDTDGGYQPQQPDHGPFAFTGNSGSIEWEIDDNFLSANAKRITVTVRRPGRRGLVHQVRYNFLKVQGMVN